MKINLRNRIVCVIGCTILVHYFYLLCYKPKVKYDQVKYHLFKQSLQNHLQSLQNLPQNDIRANLKILMEKLTNPNYNEIAVSEGDDHCSNVEVCNEFYKGNLEDLPWHEKAWVLDPNCTKTIENKFSIILMYDFNHTFEIVKSIRDMYPTTRIIIGYTNQDEGSNSLLIRWSKDKTAALDLSLVKLTRKRSDDDKVESENWKRLVEKVNTNYVFIGYKLRKLQKSFGTFERMIRYVESKCDCMVCDVIWDHFGPFMAFKEDLQTLDSSLSSELMFTDFFLKLRSKGHSVFSCPDVMFHTKKGPFDENPSRNEWLQLAKKWELHAISIEMGPLKIHQFSCDEIGVTCNAEKQAQFYIVPWCCLQAAHHVMQAIDHASEEVGFHYELDSGSLLGAVKMQNFIPWDIDGDLYTRTEDMHHFHEGGTGRFLLESHGIKFHSWSNDNYWDVGAGHYQLSYGGLEFELMGKRGNLTKKTDEPPTRVLYGNTWSIAHHHPGQYLRGRYGPQYLKHVQSWKFVTQMENAFDSYGSNVASFSQTHCEDPSHHACLELYPNDGNIEFLPHRFP